MERWVYPILTLVVPRLYNNIQATLGKIKYKIIDSKDLIEEKVTNPEVWSTGKILEKYGRDLDEVIDKWNIFRLIARLPIPRTGDSIIKELREGVLHA